MTMFNATKGFAAAGQTDLATAINAQVAEPVNQIAFGTGTDLDSDADFTYMPSTGGFYVNTQPGEGLSLVSSATPDFIDICAANNSGTGNGGRIFLLGGEGGGTGIGGVVNITAGLGGATGDGGGVTLTSGAGGFTSGNSGSIAIATGSVTSGSTGAVDINTGDAVGVDMGAGGVTILPGTSTGTIQGATTNVRGGPSAGSGAGGVARLRGGTANGTGAGGQAIVLGGTASATGAGGAVDITGGAGGSTSGNGGDVSITSGTATVGDGGDIALNAGAGSVNGGSITIVAGTGATVGTIQLSAGFAVEVGLDLKVGGSAGTAGSLLRSTGTGTAPAWTSLMLKGSQSFTFGAIADNTAGASSNTATVTGAAVGDEVVLGLPSTGGAAGFLYAGYVSAADTVTVRAVNNGGGTGAGAADATLNVVVIKHANV